MCKIIHIVSCVAIQTHNFLPSQESLPLTTVLAFGILFSYANSLLLPHCDKYFILVGGAMENLCTMN